MVSHTHNFLINLVCSRLFYITNQIVKPLKIYTWNEFIYLSPINMEDKSQSEEKKSRNNC